MNRKERPAGRSSPVGSAIRRLWRSMIRPHILRKTWSTCSLRVYSFRCSPRSQSQSGLGATYMAFPGGFKSVLITASLRHVHGFPVLGLLRRLRPSDETSPDLAACRTSRVRRSARGSRVHRRNPRCCRWSAVPLAARTAVPFGTGTAACPMRAHPVAVNRRPSSGCVFARCDSCSVQRLPSPTSTAQEPRLLHHDTFGSPRLAAYGQAAVRWKHHGPFGCICSSSALRAVCRRLLIVPTGTS